MASTTTSIIYSKPWLGRPFVLTGDSLSWGCYVIHDPSLRERLIEEQDAIRAGFHEADPNEVATAFEHLIHVYRLGCSSEFLAEMQALATYHYAKEHLTALKRIDCSQEDYDRGRAAMESAFDAALSAVFKAAEPRHGLNAKFVRYHQLLRGMQLATFIDEKKTYIAAFTSDSVLESVNREVTGAKRGHHAA